MKIKVCGMKYPENIENVQALQPDFMGFIFYKKSPRYLANGKLPQKHFSNEKIASVGVFVNSPLTEVMETFNKYKLDFVQLHGTESPAYVKELQVKKVKIIKAFQVNESFTWSITKQYKDHVRYFLFDTATQNHGGSGLKFDWDLLKKYEDKIPFFLSGGIGVEDLELIKKLDLPQLFGIDVNSKFETQPGIKNVALIKKMINQIRNESSFSSK